MSFPQTVLRWFGLVLCLSLLVADQEAAGQEGGSTDDEATSQIVEAFNGVDSLPWYDYDNDGVRPVDVAPRLDDTVNRQSRWIPKSKKTTPKQTTNPGTAGTPPARGFWSALASLFTGVVGWALLGVVVFLVALGLVLAIVRMEGADVETTTDGQQQLIPTNEEIAKLEDLPIEIRKGTGNLLERADQLRSAGKLAEALVYLFSHRLLQLDRAHAIRLARGKTNRQYLRELRNRPDLRNIMQDTVLAFERSYFGRHEVTQQQYDALRSEQQALDSLVTALKEVA